MLEKKNSKKFQCNSSDFFVKTFSFQISSQIITIFVLISAAYTSAFGYGLLNYGNNNYGGYGGELISDFSSRKNL